MPAMVGPAVRALLTGDVVLDTGLVAILRKYYKTKWAKARTGSVVKEKLREACPYVLRSLCLLAASALAKASFKATRLFQLTYLFLWKAQKSPNKHPLKQAQD
jgi:hypothetical protein